ncbi:hypothetical protein WH95_19560 [Kiloniella litopenaei]|uniref:Uncharacterized protein n=1 Tax=Kiloniella litopenaei TaxID=1549748 RepID=A0A0M2R6S3_9PROT|nr:hypothetical protein [Kiloniella litopenaei]KKJ75218.1 hypothetical protein WH95_19560 [Kiloniella litopenaei]
MSEASVENDTEIVEKKTDHSKKFIVVAGGFSLVLLILALGIGMQSSSDKSENQEVEQKQNPAHKPKLTSLSFEEGFSNAKRTVEAEQQSQTTVVYQEKNNDVAAWEQELLAKKRKNALLALQGEMQLEENKDLEEVGSNSGYGDIDPDIYVNQRTDEIDDNISALQEQLKALETGK